MLYLFREIPYEGWTQVADEVFVEGVKLSTDLISKISWTHPIVVLPPPRAGSNAVVHDKYYYHGPHPGEAEVGDVRIFYECSGISGSTRVAAQERVSFLDLLSGSWSLPMTISVAKSSSEACSNLTTHCAAYKRQVFSIVEVLFSDQG